MADENEVHLPLRRAESAAGFTLFVQLAAGGVALLPAYLSHSAAAAAEAWHLLAGSVVWLVVLVHQRLRRLAAEEALEAESLAKADPSRPQARLFDAEGTDLLNARNRLAQFEKVFLPIASGLIAVLLGVLSYFLLKKVALATSVEPVTDSLRNLFVFAGIAFVSFLLAKYSAGLATQRPWRPVRPGANYLMSCALGSLLVAVGFGFSFFELPVVERVLAWAIPVLLAVMSAETLLHLVMGVYRPRVAGQEPRAAHDSRLLGMLTTSRGLLRTTADTLDYQFGFKVSETWFYRFMERALGPLILFQAAALSVLTCFVVIDTGEQAVVERFGRPVEGRKTLGPGLHMKWPWPIDIVQRHPTERVEMLQIGEQLQEDVPGFLWTKTHAKAPFMVLAANEKTPTPSGAKPEGTAKGEGQVPGVSTITGTVYVFYHVSDLYSYLYNHGDPRRTLEALCYRELCLYAGSTDFLQFLGFRRAEAVATLRKRIQASADAEKLGVQLVDVTLQGLHPPVQVADAFEAVVGALEEREARVWAARAYESTVVPEAEAEAEVRRAEARIYATARTHIAPATEKQFLMQKEAHDVAPSVFRHRKLVSALEEALAEARKIVKPVWADVSEVLNVDLEEKLLPGFGSLIETTEE